MRQVLFIFLFFCTTFVYGQSFQNYKDTVNHFSINVPTGWRYGIPQNQPTIKFVAYRIPSSPTDTVRDNFNLNIIETPKMNLNDSYLKILKSISEAKNFKILDNGKAQINGRKFKWLIESHQNGINRIQMHNYVFVTYQNDKTYILTMVTFSTNFETIKPTFTQIANSLKLTE